MIDEKPKLKKHDTDNSNKNIQVNSGEIPFLQESE